MTPDAHSVPPVDLTREVYGILGVPVDAIEMPATLHRIETAIAASVPFLISTVNLNFLAASRSDRRFRDSLLRSDLCTADGMPIVWMARLLGIPIKKRVAGSDIFDALKGRQTTNHRLKVFLFGGAEGAAKAACAKLNAEPSGIACVGAYAPGFGTVEEMSAEAIIDTINGSDAEFLAVALGAKKGQAWLLCNHNHLRIPVRVHLGATLNFQAGTLKRAPERMQKWGLEWLWRIKEEPQLWQRYWRDGIVLFRLLLTQVLPLMFLDRWHQIRWGRKGENPIFIRAEDHKFVILSINGDVTVQNLGSAVSCFQDAAAAAKNVVINFANTRRIDARFLGLLLMLSKRLKEKELHLELTGVSPRIARIFRLNGFGFLLSTKAESVE